MKYLSYYDVSSDEGRASCLAATNKMDYICRAIVENGEAVKIAVLVAFIAFGLFSLYSSTWAMTYPYYWFWS